MSSRGDRARRDVARLDRQAQHRRPLVEVACPRCGALVLARQGVGGTPGPPRTHLDAQGSPCVGPIEAP